MTIYISVHSGKLVISTSESLDRVKLSRLKSVASQQIFEQIKFQMVGVAVYRDAVLDFWKHWFNKYRVHCTCENCVNMVWMSRVNTLLVTRAAMGRARFIIYPWFIFLCWLRAPDSPRPALNHAICNVYSKLSKSCWNINTRTMLQILCSLLCGIYIFFCF